MFIVAIGLYSDGHTISVIVLLHLAHGLVTALIHNDYTILGSKPICLLDAIPTRLGSGFSNGRLVIGKVKRVERSGKKDGIGGQYFLTDLSSIVCSYGEGNRSSCRSRERLNCHIEHSIIFRINSSAASYTQSSRRAHIRWTAGRIDNGRAHKVNEIGAHNVLGAGEGDFRHRDGAGRSVDKMHANNRNKMLHGNGGLGILGYTKYFTSHGDAGSGQMKLAVVAILGLLSCSRTTYRYIPFIALISRRCNVVILRVNGIPIIIVFGKGRCQRAGEGHTCAIGSSLECAVRYIRCGTRNGMKQIHFITGSP